MKYSKHLFVDYQVPDINELRYLSHAVELLVHSGMVNVPHNIEVYLTENIPCYGLCDIPDENGVIATFVSKNSPMRINTLCHEFVHAEQFFEGRLSSWLGDGRSTYYSWNGVVYKVDGLNKLLLFGNAYERQLYSEGYAEYRKFPWEVEANERASKMSETLEKHLKGFEYGRRWWNRSRPA